MPIKKMTSRKIKPILDRVYNESSDYQFLRELVINSIEAGATRIEIHPQWSALDQEIARFQISDNGKGMEPHDLEEYMNTFGEGSKPIGGEHENYGVGAKSSLLPWNKHGLVICSWTQRNPDGAMIWLRLDEQQNEYGLHIFSGEDGSNLEVIVPNEQFARARPPWLVTGTVVIAMGNTGNEHTYLEKPGTPSRGISSNFFQRYLNDRLWRIPENVLITCAHYKTSNSLRDNQETWVRGTVRGAFELVPQQSELSGSFQLSDNSLLYWYLSSQQPPSDPRRTDHYIGALYKNELYDVSTHQGGRFRQFGIISSAVARRLVIVVAPPMYSENNPNGVFPNSSRVQLLQRGGKSLPWSDWGHEFVQNMPKEIQEALDRSRPKTFTTIKEKEWRDRLQAKWARELESEVPDTDSDGDSDHPERPEHKRRQKKKNKQYKPPGPPPDWNETKTKRKKTKGAFPDAVWVRMEDIDPEKEYAACWCPPNPNYPKGLVQLARDFEAFVEVRQYWQRQYPDHLASAVQDKVEEVYASDVIARVVQIQQKMPKLDGWSVGEVKDTLLTPETLTASILGWFGEHAAIANALHGLGSKKKKAS